MITQFTTRPGHAVRTACLSIPTPPNGDDQGAVADDSTPFVLVLSHAIVTPLPCVGEGQGSVPASACLGTPITAYLGNLLLAGVPGHAIRTAYLGSLTPLLWEAA